MTETPVLITIAISHYCEKARWALDRAGIYLTLTVLLVAGVAETYLPRG